MACDATLIFVVTARDEVAHRLRDILADDYQVEVAASVPEKAYDLLIYDGLPEQLPRGPVLLLNPGPPPEGVADTLPESLDPELVLRRVARSLHIDQLERQVEQASRVQAAQSDQLRHVHMELEMVTAALAADRERRNKLLRETLHELRNPLNAILGFSRLVRRKADDYLAPRQLANLDRVMDAGRQLQAMLEEMVERDRLGSHTSLLTLTTIDCNRVLDGLERRFQKQASEKGLQLEFQVHDPPLFLRTDLERLTSILAELISNAIKFSSSGRVRVEFSRYPPDQATEVRCQVTDQGPGLPFDDPDEVFLAFQQGKEGSGGGLGLALARRHAETLGGKLSACHSCGQGCCFCLSLKRSSLMEPVVIPPAGEGPEVLVIDDEVPALEVLRGLLSGRGYRVHVANTATAGLEKAREVLPRLIITDISMPDMTGFELVHLLKGQDPTAQIPILAWTGTFEPQELEGVSAWLTKPFDLDRLQAVVDRLVRPVPD